MCFPFRFFLSRVFLVPKENGKKRPVLNLKRLNQFLNPKPFRLINYQQIPKFIQENDYMMKVDLKNAYFHIPVQESHRRFLAFVYKGQFFNMTCLPFGIATAPLVFSRITNWIAGMLRSRGVRIVVYLDDFLLANQDPVLLAEQARETIHFLRELGFVINVDKTSWVPTHMIEYLGIVWDSEKNVKLLSVEKVKRTRQQIRGIIQRRTWNWQEAKSVIGRLSFAAFVVPLGRLHCRSLQIASNTIPQFTKKKHCITQQALEDLHWWLENTDLVSSIWSTGKMSYLITDASDWGWGAVLNDTQLSQQWEESQSKWHSNRKELWAVLSSIKVNVDSLRNHTVQLQTDNRTVAAYIRKEGGTKSRPLLEMTRELLELCHNYAITLEPHYVPGRYNTAADHLSRGRAPPDWCLSEKVREMLFTKWGIPEIDLFATQRSAVVSRYVSIDVTDQEAAYINAFSRIWNHRLAWLFPPPTQIPRVLHHLNSAVGVFILIVPRWDRVFWRADIKSRALEAPMVIRNLQHHLKDLTTGHPPPGVDRFILEAWKVRGGSSNLVNGENKI